MATDGWAPRSVEHPPLCSVAAGDALSHGRYHTELAGLGSLRAAAAESAALKDRLAEASAAAAALAAARDETRSRLDAANAALAAASEQKRQLEQAAQIKKTVQAAVSN